MQLAQDLRSGRLVAIKFLPQGPGFDEKVIARELLNHKACAMHPHIVQLQVRCQTTAQPPSLTMVDGFTAQSGRAALDDYILSTRHLVIQATESSDCFDAHR